jgi:diguanylate cyclase (GGDEF) domain
MGYDLIKSLLLNVTLMITILYIAGRVRPFNERFKSRFANLLYTSLSAAVLAILCMVFPIVKSAGYQFDMRSTPIVILGMASGFAPAMAAAAIAGIYRILIGGSSAYYGIIFGTVIPALFGGAYYWINRLKRNTLPAAQKFGLIPMAIMGIILWIKDNIAFGYFIAGGGELINRMNVYLLIAHVASFIAIGYVIRDTLKLSQHHYMLREEALTDELTRLKNYRYIVKEVYKLTDSVKNRYDCLSVMMMDIDDFKMYNDTYGHLEGDKVLKAISRILNESVRGSDIVARYGGEEFLIILKNVRAADAFKIADRIRMNVNKLIFSDCTIGVKCKVTISTGISEYPAHGDNMHDIINKADIALYKAKELGKNNVQIYHADINVAQSIS